MNKSYSHCTFMFLSSINTNWKLPFFSTKNAMFLSYRTLTAWIFPFLALFTWNVSNDMLFILFACVCFEQSNRVRKWTTIDDDVVVTALSFVSYSMVLFFLLVRSICFNGASFYYVFGDECRVYSRLLGMAMTTCAERCMLWYVVDNCWLTFLEFVPFLISRIIAILISILISGLCFIVRWNVVVRYLSDICVIQRDIKS